MEAHSIFSTHDFHSLLGNIHLSLHVTYHQNALKTIQSAASSKAAYNVFKEMGGGLHMKIQEFHFTPSK